MPKHFKNEQFERALKIDARGIDKKARTVEIAFSSEIEVERYFGEEVLDHSPESVRLDRINNGGALLVNHDRDDQVGVIDKAWVDADRKGRATIRFGNSKRAGEIFDDVVNDIRQLVSVAYKIHKTEETEQKGRNKTVRVLDWEPIEISIVAIPADSTVGVGRSKETKLINGANMPKEDKIEPKEPVQRAEPEGTKTPAINVRDIQEKTRKDELARINAIEEMGDKFDLSEKAREYIENGKSIEDFRQFTLDEVGKRNTEARSKSESNGDVDLTDKEQREFSLFRALYAISNPNDPNAQKAAAFEFEVSRAGVDAVGSGFESRGLYVPDSVLSRTLTAGTATDGAELVAENLLAGSFIDMFRNAMVTAQAGTTMLPGLVGNVLIPRQTGGAASAWLSTEGADAAESEAQFDQIALTPKDLACYTEVTRRLMQQSTPAAEGLVRRDLAIAQALGVDSAVLYGTGATGQPRGVANQTGINTVTFTAAKPTYEETIGMVKEVMLDNALMGSIAYITDPEGWAGGKTTEKFANTGRTVISDDGTINGYRNFVTNQVTADDWFFGNWADVLIGEWGGLELTVDPYTKALSGGVRFIVFKTVDVAVRHSESFVFGRDA